MTNKGMDADRKKIVWKELYSKVYTEERWILWRYFDFENLFGKNQAPIRKEIEWEKEADTPEKDFAHKYEDILSVSGDADITIRVDDKKEEIYRFSNFSLMLCTGGMNDAKGGRQFVDFIRILDEYYKSKQIDPLFRNVGRQYKDSEKQKLVTDKKKNCLKAYLDLSSDIYQYCERVYQIDEELVNKLLEAKDDSCIMKEYWNCRRERMKEMGVDEVLMEKNIDEEDD